MAGNDGARRRWTRRIASVLAVALLAAGVLAIPIRGKPLALRWKHFVRDLIEQVSGRPVRPPPPGWTPSDAK